MACQCFRISRGIVIDLYSSFKDFPPDRPCFGVFTPEGGLRIIEVELNLVSEVLHTKDQVADSVRGIMSKFICFGSVVAALSVFYFQVEKHGFNVSDVRVTYTFFLGAMALEIISYFRFVYFRLDVCCSLESSRKLRIFYYTAVPRTQEITVTTFAQCGQAQGICYSFPVSQVVRFCLRTERH